MSEISKEDIIPSELTECSNVFLLANMLGTNYKSLSTLIYGTKQRYRTISIPKKSNGVRVISIPVYKLKEIQWELSKKLNKYYYPKTNVHGFILKRNIKTNASPHVDKRHVFNLDLKDFFTSISFGRVKRLLESYPLNLNHRVATVIAQICCSSNGLPQGAPTSPVISNMICYKLDNELIRYAKKNHFSYTRYVDDITFSFDKKDIPTTLYSCTDDEVGKDLRLIIENNGFQINSTKVRTQSKYQRQVVTGLTVNKKVNVSKKFIKQTSSMIYALSKFGPINAEEEHFSKYHNGDLSLFKKKKMSANPGEHFKKIIKGRLNFIRMIKGPTCNVYRMLMLKYNKAVELPHDKYLKNWLDTISDSVFILINNKDVCQGSGFLLKDIGIVTNYHVLESITKENISESVQICSHRGTHLDDGENELILLNPDITNFEDHDISIIKSAYIDPIKIRPLQVEKEPDYDPNTKVFLIGYPNYRSNNIPTITPTTIKNSCSFMKNSKRIQVKDGVVTGSSGGAVINTNGLVIGIISDGNSAFSVERKDCMFIPITILLSCLDKKNRNTNNIKNL